MIIKEQNKIEFINDCNAIFDVTELENAILWYQTRPTTSSKKIYMHGNYPAISIFNEKIHIHRLLMMYWLKSRIPREYYVHHIDGNKMNSSKNNLSVIFESVHQSNHNKGKKLSSSTKELISKANQNRKGIKIGITKSNVTYQKIWDLHNKGYSINRISKVLNYDWSQVKLRINEIYENPELLEGRE